MKNAYEKNIAGIIFRYFVVVVTALVATFGIMTFSKAMTQRGTEATAGVPAAEAQNTTTIFRNGPGPDENSSRYDAMIETAVTASNDSEKLLSDMVTIPSGKYNTMFRIATDVEDYYGNTYSKAYLLHGDGLAGHYNNAVKFRNDSGYSWIRGQIALENTEYNEQTDNVGTDLGQYSTVQSSFHYYLQYR